MRSARDYARERKSKAENPYIGPIGVKSSLPPSDVVKSNELTRRKTMDNRYVEAAGQRDREFEELLCLAYLFTHSVYGEAADESEILQVDDSDLYANVSWN
jgi:hypothetical protein